MFFAGFVAGLMTWAVLLGISSYMAARELENSQKILYLEDGPSVGPGKQKVGVTTAYSWYWAPGGDSCTWRVLDGQGQVIAEKSNWVNQMVDLGDPKAVVFESLGCGDWHPIMYPLEELRGPDAPRVEPVPQGRTEGISL
ncbi:hypothetical protein M0E87_08340 [Corynebacterium sp. CCM 9185]|uniref:DUF3592 domain-containing protein n=1 Tax=Corynebacterium marambiense TaxID=2765364 RepID=A0ABS0VYC5_9CORY|nr:hypothetical protein [Corynebacterium marambiense]MBI9000312.1 hypothetical protein [Corynebacterium marambiense]MCK7663665.1 hypothetical protein [Corynebacterium marambiense]MCX7541899.1 hypothetical protein [Corynebacterium marambiense]